jgi:hypothetical protein
MSGSKTRPVAVEERIVGPFRFTVIQVQPAGRSEPQLVLAFAPAYGEQSADLVDAAVTAGARNFMLAGAGGSLIPSDQLGAIHQIVAARVGKTTFDLRQTSNLNLLELAGSRPASNVFSATPLEQTDAWADAARRAGADNVDQETGHIARALVAAAQRGIKLNVQMGLYQSDVVGKGLLGQRTVDKQYDLAVQKMARSFFAALGVSGVKTEHDTFAPIATAKAGLLASQTPTRPKMDDIKVPLPDLSTIGDSQQLSSVQQFKGQRRVIQVRTNGFGAKERRMLRELLRELNGSQFWVNVAQSDPNHGEILDIAKEAGFETILVSTTDAVREERVLGRPTFLVKEKSEQDVKATMAEFARDGKNDEYEANTAQHYQLYLGDFKPRQERKGEIYSALIDADDIADVADDMRREARAQARKVKEEIRTHFASRGAPAPRFLAIEELGEYLDGRKPIMISGASQKSWPEMAPEQQAYARLMLTLLARTLDPKKFVIVTGATDHGVEAIAHEVFGRAGFDILGTIVENTRGPEVSTYVRNLVFTGINWFGMARPAYREIVEAFNGQNITVGGGAILRDMIQLALKLNLRVHNWDGPTGASSDAARQYAAHAFRDVAALFERMGLDAAALPKAEPPARQVARWWTPEQIAWVMPKSFRAAGQLDREAQLELTAFCSTVNGGGLGAQEPMEAQVRARLPRTLKLLETTEELKVEFPKLIAALEQTRAAQAKGRIITPEERASLVKQYDELTAQLAEKR